MRVAFAGSCQVTGLAAAARLLRPDLAYSQYHVGATGTTEEVRDAVAGSDWVVTQFADEHPEGALLGPRALADAGLRAIYLPIFVFRGLHPDMMYLTERGEMVPGPVGPYHSLVVAAATLNGVAPARIVRLLNAHVYAELGLGGYDAARAATIASYAEAGYDVAPAFARFEAAGEPFVHTFNHPGAAVHAELAALALARMGLVPQGTPAPEDLPDYLGNALVAPVLPAVTRRLGMRATTVWREAGQGDDSSRDVTLEDYAERARVLYRERRQALLANARVRAASERLRALLGGTRYERPSRSFASAAEM